VRPEKLRQRVLAEWRGMPEIPFVRETAKLVTEPLAKVMAALGLGDRLREEEVKKAWREIAGEFIAGQSSPDSLRAGVLCVRVAQSPMLYELDRVWKAELLKKLKSRFGARTVREIRFRIG
jgi:predicted nucleic acid-binding Zn ribbon protein